MKNLSLEEETGAIVRPHYKCMNALRPKEEDDRIAAKGKEGLFITPGSIGRKP